jgi:hypothetical protein
MIRLASYGRAGVATLAALTALTLGALAGLTVGLHWALRDWHLTAVTLLQTAGVVDVAGMAVIAVCLYRTRGTR